MHLKFCKQLLLSMFGFIALSAYSQLNPSVMFRYAGNDVTVDEFERQFLKNVNVQKDTITAEDIDEYLQLYIKFKLKFQDAHGAKLDTVRSYREELAGYKSQLSKNYLFDREVTDQLIMEAYNRMKFEVRAAHILVNVAADANPADTAIAYKKILAIYNTLRTDPSKFSEMASSGSDDPGTKESGGDLGFFTALQLVYPFENMAYNTEIGKISGIFRTQFGYHIIKVLDKRPNRGDIKVRHIMLRTGTKPDQSSDAVKAKMDEIYLKIRKGEATFENMARNYSEDYNSRYNGGEMDYFAVTQFVGDVERQRWAERAFALPSNNDFTEPFQTTFGWHILQRLDVRPLGTYEQLKLIIKNQVQSDQRAQKSVDALVTKVKNENDYLERKDVLNAFIASLDTNFVKGKFSKSNLPEYANVKVGATAAKGVYPLEFKTTPLLKLPLFTLGKETHIVSEFSSYIEKNVKPTNQSAAETIAAMYNEWVKSQCVNFQERHLEEKSAEFRNIYQEYTEGILMFNRMQEMVWDKANTDTVGLAKYFEEHQQEYKWTPRFDCVVMLCASDKIAKNVVKKLNKNLSPDSIKRAETKLNALNVDYRQGKYELSDTFLFPDKRILEILFSDPKYRKANKVHNLQQIGSDWVVVKVNSYTDATTKKLDETRGPVASKYQDYLEEQWVANLRQRYSVEINDEALKALKLKLVRQ